MGLHERRMTMIVRAGVVLAVLSLGTMSAWAQAPDVVIVPEGQSVAVPEGSAVVVQPKPETPDEPEKTLDYLPPDMDLSIGGGRAAKDAPPDTAFWGIEFESMRRRMVNLENRVESLEKLVMQHQQVIESLLAQK